MVVNCERSDTRDVDNDDRLSPNYRGCNEGYAKVRVDFTITEKILLDQGLLQDWDIFANLRLTFVSSSNNDRLSANTAHPLLALVQARLCVRGGEGGGAVVRGAAMPIRQYSVVAESTLAASLVAVQIHL